MDGGQIFLFALFGVVFALLLWGRWRYDLVAFAALLVAAVAGAVPADAVFSGFGHPATVIVALVLVISRGLTNSGVVHLLTRHLVDPERPLAAHIAVMGGLGAALSAFMNNVAALALLMPVDIQTAKKAGRSPRFTLMPLAFATILGGMVTLIGTPPNIIIASYREQALGAPYLMFDFAPVGLVTALAGLAFVALVGWRLIGDDRGAKPAAAGGPELEDYIADIRVPDDSPAVGKTLEEIEEEADRAGVALLGVLRGGRRYFGGTRQLEVKAGDILVVEAAPEALDEFRTALRLKYEGERRPLGESRGEGLGMMEVVVPEGARIAGRTAEGLRLLARRGVTLIGISRRGRRIRERVRRTVVEPGDILLLFGPADRLPDVAAWLGCLPLAERGLPVTRPEQRWIAAGAFILAVLAASLGFVYLPVALGAVVVAYALAGVVPLREVYENVEWPVVVLLGSMIPLGAALEQAGGTALIAGWIVALAEGMPPWVLLTVLMVATMSLSDVLNNTATTIIAAPIALETAARIGASPDPFLMGVAVSASCAFLTPIGHKNNTLILGPGGYAFADYWRMGLPLELIVLAVSIPTILVVWPL